MAKVKHWDGGWGSVFWGPLSSDKGEAAVLFGWT